MSDADYNPTVGDIFPTLEAMPEDLRRLCEADFEASRRRAVEIEHSRTATYKSWWQVDHTKAGHVARVTVNKPAGAAAGMWSFERSINDEGAAILHVIKYRHIDEMSAYRMAEWRIPTDELAPDELTYVLAGLVGLRTAAAALRRLEIL